MTILRQFDPFVREFEALVRGTPQQDRGWAPAVDVFEREGALVVRALVPGVSPDDLDIRVEDGKLTIAGTRASDQSEKGSVYRREIQYGSFARTIVLPERADVSAIKASHRDGVLEVTVPKPAELQPHKIAIEAF